MSAFLKKLRILLTPEDKKKLLFLILLMSGGALLEILGIGLLMPVVAVFLEPRLLEQNALLRNFCSLLPGMSRLAFLIVCCSLVGIVYLLKNLFSLYVTAKQASYLYRKQSELAIRLYHTYLSSSYAFHLEHSGAELNLRILRGTQVCIGVLLPFMLFASDLFVVAALAAVLIFFMPGIFLGSVLFFLTVGGLSYYSMRHLNGTWGKTLMRWESAASRFRLDGLQGIKEVIAAGRANYFTRQYAVAETERFRFEKRLFVLGQCPRLLLESAAILLALGIFVVMALLQIPNGTILLTFSLLIAALSRMLPAFSRMHYNLTRMRQSAGIFEEFFHDLTAIPPETQIKEECTPLTLKKTLEIRSLDFGYGEHTLFHNFSLKIPAYSRVALIGATGCGKTTLVDLILGLQKPQKGEILADGLNIEENLAGWRSIAAYVPQDIFLLDDTVRANVAFGAEESEIDDARVVAALKDAQVWDVVSALEDGINARIGENGIRLSGGQRQRIGIARALYRAPKLLILDEATSALDNETEKAIVAALESLRGRLTMISIAHRLSTVEHCDVRIQLDQTALP